MISLLLVMGVNMPYLIECLRGLDMGYQPFQGVQVCDRLNLGDDGLRCLTEFKVEHPGDAFNQTLPSGSVWCL
jgi:hypothetical protein